MFNDKYGLTASVLNGTKTMTRRIVPAKSLKRNDYCCRKLCERGASLQRMLDVAQRIESAMRDRPDTVHPTNDCTVRNVHRYCEVLCRYIRSNATLDEVMAEYQYEDADTFTQSEKLYGKSPEIYDSFRRYINTQLFDYLNGHE